MMWFFLILAAVIGIPLVIELTRKTMSDKARTNATGQLAQLSQGITYYEWFGPPRGPRRGVFARPDNTIICLEWTVQGPRIDGLLHPHL